LSQIAAEECQAEFFTRAQKGDAARIQLEYWEKWGGDEWEAMDTIARAFNASQDACAVVMAPAGDWSSSPDLPKFRRALDRKDPPDLIGLENHQIADLASQGVLTPLSRILEPTEIIGAGFDERFLALGTCGGDLYSLPISADIVTLYINLATVRGTPFEGGRIPADLAEFDLGLDELRAKGKLGFVPVYPGWWPHAWAWFFGGSWFDATGRFILDQQGNVCAYEWVASFRRRGGLEAFAEPVNPIGAKAPDAFFSGEAAMVLDGDWLVRRLVRLPELAWKPAAVPTAGLGPAALICADVLAVPTGARHPEGAAEFIRFASKPERIEQLGHRAQEDLPPRALGGWLPSPAREP
jgi:ABC-type glycerol-3-phosphate transport system substrate-binding protein